MRTGHRAVLILFALHASSSVALSQQPSAPPSEDATRCAALGQLRLEWLREAPTRVTAARLVDVPALPANASPQSNAGILAASPIKQYCQVLGYVAPQNKFELRLPLPAQWNEKFFMAPCAGFCGAVGGNACNPSLARGYASVTMNGGHDGPATFDGTWAANAPNLQEDFGWRSVHVVTVAAKEITRRFYGRSIQRSYISGCSKAGQTVLSEIQRFPADYDGAIAIAPAYDFVGQVTQSAWFAQSVSDGTGRSVIDSAVAAAVHKSVLERCGSMSGVAEPFVADPLACDWKPQMMACPSGGAPSCLDATQVAAISRLMRDATDSRGTRIYRGHVPGTETDWQFWFYLPGGAIRGAGHYAVSEQFTAFMAEPVARDSVDPLKLDVAALPARLARARSVYDATSPNLSAFKARGGRLIMWHGLSDGGVPAKASVDYYDKVTSTMGGRQNVDDFFRLFLLPGVHHCAGGPGPDNVDAITAVENWVERGIAPAELIARKFVGGAEQQSRPVYPYPAKTRYTGSGDPLRASSFVRSQPD